MNLSRLFQKRSKRRVLSKTSSSAACLATETLERRTLLTVPAAVTVTGLEITNVSDNLASLTWEAQAEVDTFEIWVSQLGYGQLDNFTVEGDRTSAFVTAAYGDWHRVWVRAINEDGTGPWGPAFTQIVGSEVPVQPNIVQWDDDRIYTTDTTPDFSWDYSFRARDYDVWVEKDGTAGPFHRSSQDNPADQSSLGNRWTSDTELEDGLYRVWARARNANGVSAWSEVSRRAVGGEQPIVTGTTDNGQNLRPTINWSEGVQSVNYELWVSSETTNQRVLFQSGLTTNSYVPDTELPAGIYRAWVRQIPEVGAALPWSQVARIEVGQDTIPGTPVVAAAPDPAGATFHDNLLLSWDPVSNGSRYEIWVSEIRTGERAILETTSESFFSVDLDLLPDFGIFRAWVRAIGSDNTQGQWSEHRQFSVAFFIDGRQRIEVVGG